ncbi:OB-fold protein [Pseudomonas viridiflava]|uniref:OB-fold protein n=1 Tax=Pseudomonas viridiflava TaxID=33069 RepID=UPI0013C2F277|nr:hypothetical protein [Pseudomonas viridiflava]
MNDVNAPSTRKVGFLLGAGIVFFPVIFSWFLFRKGHSTLSRVLGFGWLILSLVVIFAAPSSPKTDEAVQTPAQPAAQVAPAQPAAKAAPAEPLKVYTASQVSSSYEENTVAADILFKGKQVKITGRIDDINTDYRGRPYLVLASKNQFMGPQFQFDKSDLEVMAQLKKGQNVTVICTGKGDVIKTPMFEDCKMSN